MSNLVLSNSLTDIEEEIEFHSHRTKKSLWEIGRRLKHVKDNDLAHGQFMEWYQSIGLNKNFVSRAITIAEEFSNFPSLGNISDTALYLVATLPEEEREKEHVTSDGQAKKVDEMTTRELEELKKQLKQKDREVHQARRSEQIALKQLEEAENKEPEVIRETVEKEVIPEDYDSIKSSNEHLQKRLKRLEDDLSFAKTRYDLLESSTAQARELEQKINSLKDEEISITRKLDAADRLKDLEKAFHDFFDTKAAPIRFKPITEELYGTNATKRIRQLVDTASHWVEEMEYILPKSEAKYAEIIEEEK